MFELLPFEFKNRCDLSKIRVTDINFSKLTKAILFPFEIGMHYHLGGDQILKETNKN